MLQWKYSNVMDCSQLLHLVINTATTWSCRPRGKMRASASGSRSFSAGALSSPKSDQGGERSKDRSIIQSSELSGARVNSFISTNNRPFGEEPLEPEIQSSWEGVAVEAIQHLASTSGTDQVSLAVELDSGSKLRCRY